MLKVLDEMLQRKGNVCLGILNGTEIGLQNMNLIGGKVLIGNLLILFFQE